MVKLRVATAAVALALCAGACASTRVTSFWRDPDTTALDFRKILVMAITADEPVRRLAEGEVLKSLKKAQGFAANALLGPEDLETIEKTRAAVQAQGFDGAITMRLVLKDEMSVAPHTAATRGYYDYLAWAWPTVSDPAYLKAGNIVHIETNIYALGQDKLVWSGLSRSFNRGETIELLEEVVHAVGAELRKQGLLR